MIKKLKDLLSDAATYGASGIIGQLIGFFLLPLYTRYLSPSEYGILAMIAILGMLFTPVANLGMTNAIFRRFNLCKEENERREVLSTGLMSVVLTSIVLGFACLMAAEPLTLVFLQDLAHKRLIQIALITATINAIGQVPTVVLRADRRVKTAALLNVISLVITTLLSIWLVVFERWGVLGIVIANLVGGVLSTIIRFAVTFKVFSFVVRPQIWKYMISYGFPIVPHHFLAAGLAQFSHYMVANILGLDEAGIYSIALRVSIPVSFVVGSIQQAWVPYKFEIHAQDESPAEFFSSAVTYYVAAITYLWVGVSFWGPEIVRLMTTPSFHSATALVPFVALIPLSQGLYWMFGTGFEFSDNTRPLPLISLLGLLVVVTGALTAIPLLGAFGAALANVFGWLTMAILIYFISQRRFRIRYDWTTLVAFAGLALTSVTISVLLVQTLPLMMRIVINSFVSLLYPGVALIILARSPFERVRISEFKTKLTNLLTRFVQNVKGDFAK
jgi:O-antigen/teichoic acid export membrane protein